MLAALADLVVLVEAAIDAAAMPAVQAALDHLAADADLDGGPVGAGEGGGHAERGGQAQALVRGRPRRPVRGGARSKRG